MVSLELGFPTTCTSSQQWAEIRKVFPTRDYSKLADEIQLKETGGREEESVEAQVENMFLQRRGSVIFSEPCQLSS